jgi:Sec7-like guanine-nucleotide exchange factor
MRQAKEKQRVVRAGRNKFNANPKDGIKYLQGQGLLGETSDEIAQWLFKGELLSKRSIGDYLGDGYV